MGAIKHSPGCGCCGSVSEPCELIHWTLTTTQNQLQGWWEVLTGSVTPIGTDRVQITDGSIRIKPTSQLYSTAYNVWFNCRPSDNTTVKLVAGDAEVVLVHPAGSTNGTGPESTLSIGGSPRAIGRSKAATETSMNGLFCPEWIAGQAVCQNDQNFSVEASPGGTTGITTISDTPIPYGKDWEIVVEGSAEITGVNFRTGTRDYNTTPPTLCQFYWLGANHDWGHSARYELPPAHNTFVTGRDIDDLPRYVHKRFGVDPGGGGVYPGFPADPPDYFYWAQTQSLRRLLRCGLSEYFDTVQPDGYYYEPGLMDGVALKVETSAFPWFTNAPSQGNEYPKLQFGASITLNYLGTTSTNLYLSPNVTSDPISMVVSNAQTTVTWNH